MPTIDEQIEKAWKLFDLCEFPKEDGQKLIDFYFKYANDNVIKSTVNFIAEQREHVDLFVDICKSIMPVGDWEALEKMSRPLVVFTPDKLDHVRVYTNIILDGVTHEQIKNIDILEVKTVLSTFIDAYKKDMSGTIPNAEKRWEGQDRINARIGKYTDMTIAAALTNVFNFKTLYTKDDKIRDLATKIEIARKPLELLFADKPEDFMIMYGPTGPHSCMVAGQGVWKDMEKHGVTATSFYAVFPWTRGAYIMKRGKVVARVILFADPAKSKSELMGYPTYDKEQGSGWAYGYIYAATTQDNMELVKALKSRGIGPLDKSNGGMAKGNTFIPPSGHRIKAPAFRAFDDYITPFPFFDNMDYRGSGFFAEFDSEAKEFIIHHQKDANGSVPANNRNGYLKASDYKTQTCDHCKKIFTKGLKGFNTDDGHLYCSKVCFSIAGYIEVHQGNGPMYTSATNKSNFVEAGDGLLFTNLKAAMHSGYTFKMPEIGIVTEDNDLLSPYGGRYRWDDMSGYRNESENAVTHINMIPIGDLSLKKVVEFDLDEQAAA